MPRLCFRHQQTGRLIAEVEADRAILIPSADDRIYAPSSEEAGVYARFRVVGREFYFDQQGTLALVNLICAETVEPPSIPAS